MDAFFASVEQRDHPELRGKPVAVGGGGPRGVVAAASYEARKFGVRSAMSGYRARQLCPELIFVRHNFEEYQAVSRQIREIFAEYTDLIEPLSLDEAYLDVTEPKIGPPSATLLAQEIRRRIFETTQLTASAGISYCKFLAKIASDLNKPNGQAVILPEHAEAFLEKLPVEKFHGIGKATAAKMHQLGIRNGFDLKQLSYQEMVRRFGKTGRFYFNIVRGKDERPVSNRGVRKSISAEHTFGHDYDEREKLLEKLERIALELEARIEKADNPGRTLTLKVKYADFQHVTRSKTLDREIAAAAEMMSLAGDLLDSTDFAARKVRLLGLGVSNLRREREQEQRAVFFLPGMQLEFEF